MAAGGRSTTTTPPQMRDSGGITADEIRRLGKALQKQEFRDLLLDYVNEVNDPTNRARYEAEVTEAERQRGYRVTFLRPEPCYVLKTTVSLKAKNSRDTTTKAFVNICQCDAIEKPSCKRVSQAIARSFYNQESGLLWTVPHSLTYPRDDADREGNKCLVYDCVYHPDTLRLARSNQQFKQMIEEIAFDAVENAFSIGIKRTGVKYPKMKFKGTPTTTLLRKKIDHKDDVKESPESSESRQPSVDNESKDIALHAPVVPEYVIKYRHRRDMQDFAYVPSPTTAATTAPDELVIEVKLPALKSVSDVTLDVTQDRLKLTSSPGTLRYALSIGLPYSVDDNGGNAKFCAATQTLVVELPVVKTTVGIGRTEEDDAAMTEDCDAEMEATVDEGTNWEEPIWERLSKLDIARLDGVKERSPSQNLNSVVRGSPPSTSFPDNPSEGADVAESPGITYVLPEFSCHQSNSELVFVLKACAVDRESVRVQYFEEGLKCRISFRAAGLGTDDTGLHYSLFLVLLPECKLEVGREQISVTEENAVVSLAKHCDSQHHWDSFRYGVDEDGAVQLEIMTMNALQRKLLILQNEIPIVAKRVQKSKDSAAKVAITEVNSERLTIEIEEPHQQNGTSTKMDDYPPNNEPDASTQDKQDGGTLGNCDTLHQHSYPNADSEQINNKTSSNHCSNNNGSSVAGHRLRTFRSFSESSDDVSPVHYPRSILKHTRRCHTLSESSDDFSWSSQDYTTVDSNIPEEGSLENLTSPTKKAVHFSEVISRNFFRSNSSILGQRKKNQRKQRKKCESRIRRSSESESSEMEADHQEGNNIETTTTCNGSTDLNQNHEVHDGLDMEFKNDNSSRCNSCSEQDNVQDNNYRNSKQDQKNNRFRKKKKQLPRQKINIAGDSASLDCANTAVSVLLCSKSSSQGKRHFNRKRTVSI